MKLQRLFICLLTLSAISQIAYAQKKLQYGIKAGMNLSQTIPVNAGGVEKGPNGESYESFQLGFRLCAGAFARLPLSERFGVQADLLYSQKGGPYQFKGPSYEYLSQYGPPTTGTLVTGGNRVYNLNPTLHYLELPVVAYYEIIPNKFEVSIGPGIALLTGATAVGNTKYQLNNPTDGEYRNNKQVSNVFEYDLSYRYYNDGAGARSPDATSTRYIQAEGGYYSPPTIIGAYYYYTADQKAAKGTYYSPFDLTANIGFAYRLSGSLRLGFRYGFSLLDITNNAFDHSMVTPNTPRSDDDRNMFYQFTLQFGFQ